MKITRYLTTLVCALAILTGCYKDKGSYFSGTWSQIDGIDGITLLGTEDLYTLDLIEEQTLSLDPQIRFKPGAEAADFTFHWILGGDTIASQLKLDWRVERTSQMLFNQDGTADFWLAIEERTSKACWCHYLQNSHGVILKVKIVQAITPKIGVFVYEKNNGSVEWGSVKGSDPTNPANFAELYTELFSRYNVNHRIEGKVTGITYNTANLIIYTDHTPDRGAVIQTSESGTYPLGFMQGEVGELIFDNVLQERINGQSFYKGNMQELLVGSSLFITSAQEPFQMILPGTTPTERDVVQIMGAKPYTSLMHFSILRKESNELRYYRYNENQGFLNQPLPDENGKPLHADQLIGVCRQPSRVEKELRMFIAIRNGKQYTLHTFSYEQGSGQKDMIRHLSKTDMTNWAEGMTSSCTLFTNGVEVPLNYLYLVKEEQLWRTSYASQDPPQLVCSFPDPITTVECINEQPTQPDKTKELYTALFTYNAEKDSSKMYVIDATDQRAAILSEVKTSIPGKVIGYRAN